MTEKQDIKIKIYQSATSLFMKKGYRKTSVRMIGQKSEISHTQVIYHFKSKSLLGSIIIKNYIEKLLEIVLGEINKYINPSTRINKLYWWSLHYLILTNYKGFSRFFIEFMTDEQDVFVETVNMFSNSVYRKLFNLNIDSSKFLTDAYIIASIDHVMARLCVEKSLKVEEAIKRLLNLNIIPGFKEEITEEEVSDFIKDNNLINIVNDFNIEKLSLYFFNFD